MSRLYQAPLTLWAAAFVAGVAIGGAGAGWLAAGLFAAAAIGALAASQLWFERPEARLSFALLLLAPLALAAGVWRADSADDGGFARLDLQRPELAEQPLTVVGVVAERPRRSWQRVELRVRTDQVRLADEQLEMEGDLIARAPLSTDAALGDRVELRGFRRLVDDPGASNWSDYAERRRAAAVGEVDSVSVLEHIGVGWARRALDDARDAVNRSLAAALPPPLAGVAQGMVTGSRDSLDRSLREDFNAAGLSHLIVISGSNVTLLAALVISASAWLIGRRSAGVLAIAAAIGYCLFVGADAPVLRATAMAVVFAAAHALGRPAGAPHALLLAAAVMTAATPQILSDVSFQLSFAGALAIAALAPTLSQRFLSGDRGLRGTLLDLAMINAIALAATMPLIALHFERVSLVALPANLLTTPLFAWMFLGGASVGIIGLISEQLASALAWPLAWLPLRWFTLIGESFAGLPGAERSVAGFTTGHATVIYAAMTIIAVRPYGELLRPRAIRSRLAAQAAPILTAAVLAAAAAAVWLAAFERDDALRIYFLDVGQGDAALIHTPTGQTVLIDGGESTDDLLAQLRGALPSGHERLDMLIVTHPQIDHIGGFIDLFGHYEIGRIVVSPLNRRAALGRRLEQLAAERGVEVAVARAGTRILLRDDGGRPPLMLDVLWPASASASSDAQTDAPNFNAESIVLRLTYGDLRALFTGDIGAAQELALARRLCGVAPCDLTAQILKVPHHGSGGSTTDLLLRRVRPSLAIISAGAGNPHGHPHADVLALLAREGAETLRTDERGRITIRSDGAAISWESER